MDNSLKKQKERNGNNLFYEKIPQLVCHEKYLHTFFRQNTGCDYLGEHFYSIGVSDDPLCPLGAFGEMITRDYAE